MPTTVQVQTGSVEQARLHAQGWTVLEQEGSRTVMTEPADAHWQEGWQVPRTVVTEPQEALPREQAPPLDPEAGRAAVQAWLDAILWGSPRNAILLACLAYQRRIRERHGPWFYLCKNGQRLDGIHPDAVRDALASSSKWGGEDGPLPEDAMARALAAARAWEARHEAEERARRFRFSEDGAREIEADLEQARRRARAHRSALDDVR